jgi:hypothetical protein
MISIRWVEEAADREPPKEGEVVVGADIARAGSDSTVFVARKGMNAFASEEYNQIDTMQSTGRLANFCELVGASRVQIDVIGLGAGVVDRLREIMRNIEIVEMGAGRPALDDKHYANSGAEWYAALAALLRQGRAGGSVFKNRRVISELTSRKRRMRSDGRWELEPKHELKKRGGRSPDWGDALAMCFAPRPKDPVADWINCFCKNQVTLNSVPEIPSKYVLNPRTSGVELVPQTKAQPLPHSEGANFERVVASYRQLVNKLSNRYSSLAGQLCHKCGEPVAETRVEDGVLVWHPSCAYKHY